MSSADIDLDMPPNVALLFPGVASGLSGDEAKLFDRHPKSFSPLFEQGSELAGVDLAKAFRGGEIDLLPPLPQQLFACAFSLALLQWLRARWVHSPFAAVGHSMGLYAALAACGAVSEADALGLVVSAYRLARAALPGVSYGMVGVLGLEAHEIDSLAAASGDHLRRVIVNNSISAVVAGPHEELGRFVGAAEAAQATKVNWLEREVPYHHPELLATAGTRFAEHLARVDFQAARFPVILSTIDGRTLAEPDELRRATAQNLCQPIDWELALRSLASRSCSAVAECGPGLSLTKIGRFIEVPLRHWNLRHWAKLEGEPP